MKFVSAQPDSDYFIWQLQVQMHNFKKFNIEKDAIILLAYDPKKGINPTAQKFKKSTAAKVIFYMDQREDVDKVYVPSIRPHILKQFAVRFDYEIRTERIFYHDCDILFKSLPDFDSMKHDVNYLSNTISYIGAEYIKSKGLPTFKKMCLIVGIDPKVVEKNEDSSGGAQYCFCPTDKMGREFWEKVERDSNALYAYMKSTEKKYLKTTTTLKGIEGTDSAIQSWCADMWAVLWNVWLVGLKTEIIKGMSFSWATGEIADWDKYNIYHNAGVVAKDTHLFLKFDYVQQHPFNENFEHLSKKHCSWEYVKEIQETAKTIDLSIYEKKK